MNTTQTTETFKAVACYVFGFFTGVIMLILEKNNQLIRFHAMQSTLVFSGIYISILLVQMVPVLGGLVVLFLKILAVILWLLLIIKAYKGEKYKLPFIGQIAEDQVGKFT